LGIEHALKFFRGGRALSSVLSRGDKIKTFFSDRFGDQFHTAGEYYVAHEHAVQIVDVSPWLSELSERLIMGFEEDE
jgi:hypothetical protein